MYALMSTLPSLARRRRSSFFRNSRARCPNMCRALMWLHGLSSSRVRLPWQLPRNRASVLYRITAPAGFDPRAARHTPQPALSGGGVTFGCGVGLGQQRVWRRRDITVNGLGPHTQHMVRCDMTAEIGGVGSGQRTPGVAVEGTEDVQEACPVAVPLAGDRTAGVGLVSVERRGDFGTTRRAMM